MSWKKKPSTFPSDLSDEEPRTKDNLIDTLTDDFDSNPTNCDHLKHQSPSTCPAPGAKYTLRRRSRESGPSNPQTNKQVPRSRSPILKVESKRGAGQETSSTKPKRPVPPAPAQPKGCHPNFNKRSFSASEVRETTPEESREKILGPLVPPGRSEILKQLLSSPTLAEIDQSRQCPGDVAASEQQQSRSQGKRRWSYESSGRETQPEEFKCPDSPRYRAILDDLRSIDAASSPQAPFSPHAPNQVIQPPEAFRDHHPVGGAIQYPDVEHHYWQPRSVLQESSVSSSTSDTFNLNPGLSVPLATISPPKQSRHGERQRERPLARALTFGEATMEAESHNGANCNTYRWAQTVSDIDLTIPVDQTVTKGGDVNVVLIGNNIKATARSVVVFEGELTKPVSSEFIWSLDPKKHVIRVNLEKKKTEFWKKLLTSENDIDISTLNNEVHVGDMEHHDRLAVEQTLARMRGEDPNSAGPSNEQGSATMDRAQMMNVLRNAWDKEGSPFEGQPFDPSAFE